jgi:hypothetical protein
VGQHDRQRVPCVCFCFLKASSCDRRDRVHLELHLYQWLERSKCTKGVCVCPLLIVFWLEIASWTVCRLSRSPHPCGRQPWESLLPQGG